MQPVEYIPPPVARSVKSIVAASGQWPAPPTSRPLAARCTATGTDLYVIGPCSLGRQPWRPAIRYFQRVRRSTAHPAGRFDWRQPGGTWRPAKPCYTTSPICPFSHDSIRSIRGPATSMSERPTAVGWFGHRWLGGRRCIVYLPCLVVVSCC